MNYNEAVTQVLDIVKRPEKLDTIKIYLNNVIRFFAVKEKFLLDREEGELSIDSTKYLQTVSLTTLSRFRSFEYVKLRGSLKYLEPISPKHIFTPGGNIQPNRYFQHGTNITILSTILASFIDVGYFTYPPILDGTENNNTHWLLDQVDSAIIAEAASRIFYDVGDDASGKKLHDRALLDFEGLRHDLPKA